MAPRCAPGYGFPQYPKLTTAIAIVNQIAEKWPADAGKRAGKPSSPGIWPGQRPGLLVGPMGGCYHEPSRRYFIPQRQRSPGTVDAGAGVFPHSASQEAFHVDLFREASLAVALGGGSLGGPGGGGVGRRAGGRGHLHRRHNGHQRHVGFQCRRRVGGGRLPGSLELVPENVAFYSAMLRNREYFEAIVNSRAWAKLKALPIVQTGLMLYKLQTAVPGSVPNQRADGPAGPRSPKEPVAGGRLDVGGGVLLRRPERGRFPGYDAAADRRREIRPGRLAAQRQSRRASRPKNSRRRRFSRRLPTTCNCCRCPTRSWASRCATSAAVKQQLERLEKQAAAALEGNPQLKGRLNEDRGGRRLSYLTLTLDGSLIPWDEVPLDDFRKIEANKGDVDKIVARLKEMTLVVAVGLREQLPAGVDRLVDRRFDAAGPRQARWPSGRNWPRCGSSPASG